MQDKQQQARDWRDARGTGRGAAQRRLREWQEKLTRAMQHCAAELSEMLGVSQEFVPYVLTYYRTKYPDRFPPSA